jgi:hypothetical protein
MRGAHGINTGLQIFRHVDAGGETVGWQWRCWGFDSFFVAANELLNFTSLAVVLTAASALAVSCLEHRQRSFTRSAW